MNTRLYLEQDRPFVTIYDRIGDEARWETADFDSLGQSVLILGQAVLLEKIYENVALNVK